MRIRRRVLVINLFGYVNINDETAHEMFVDVDTSGKADLYTAEGDNWYVVSWCEDDTIIYEKTIVTDSTIATAAFGVLDCKPRHGVEDYRHAAADVSGGLGARAYSRQSETPIARAPDLLPPMDYPPLLYAQVTRKGGPCAPCLVRWGGAWPGLRILTTDAAG